jgi:hypothetical protein
MGFFSALAEAMEGATSPLRSHRGRRSMQVQSLLFDRDYFTVRQAKAWAARNGFKHGKVDETDKYIRLRQRDPGEFRVKRTITLTDGVRAVVGR